MVEWKTIGKSRQWLLPLRGCQLRKKGQPCRYFFNKFIVHMLEACPTGCSGEELFSQSAKCAAALRWFSSREACKQCYTEGDRSSAEAILWICDACVLVIRFFFQVRTELVLKERQAAILVFQELLENKTANTERLPALQSAVPCLAQSSVEKVKHSEDLFKDLEENSSTGLQLLLSSEASSPVRDTCKAIVKRLVHDKVGSQFKKIK